MTEELKPCPFCGGKAGSSKGYRCVEHFNVMLLSQDKYKKCDDFKSVIQFLKENFDIGAFILNNI